MQTAQELSKSVNVLDLAPFFDGDRDTAAYFARHAEWVSLPAQETVVRQFHEADYIYLLVDGSVSYGVHVDDSAMLICVGDTAAPWTPIGWSGLRPPGRYSSTVYCSALSCFIRWHTPDLWRLLYAHPEKGIKFVESMVRGGLPLLESTRKGIRSFGQLNAIAEGPITAPEPGQSGARSGSVFDGQPGEAADLLAGSPFFREFTNEERTVFAAAGRFIRVRRGDHILVQGDPPDGVYVLMRGRVSLKFHTGDHSQMVTRTISRTGTVFNWYGINRPLPTPFSVGATRDTALFFIPGEAIARAAQRNPEFGFVYSQRVLWLLSQFFLSARTRLVSQQAENEVLAVSSLIEQKATEIPLRSELYRIPPLLSHPVTRSEAFTTLHRLVTNGTPLERSLAGLQLDILTELERETRFRDKLAYVYERVAGAGPSATRAELLHQSAEGMLHAFEEVPYVIEGIDNLPDDPGFIVIYNHLACNKQYQLPNNFEFTLDSHFVSALLLRHYGTPGLRIVKTSDSDEFWHRGYYGRILSIKVSADDTRLERARFYQTVQNTLAAHTPVVIAPEGTNDTNNNWTETSPGQFQPGAFVLGTRMTPEPWIFPIALANFDKSVKNSVFAAVIKPPFRMSEFISDPEDRAAMNEFIETYRMTFRGYVREARELAEEIRERPVVRTGLMSNLERLDALDSEFADDVHQLEDQLRNHPPPPLPVVFYGSSSFRMWDHIKDDLDLPNAANLGFGGATLEACAHYFERLVTPLHPSALFIYAGDNDIGNGASGDEVVDHARSLLYKIDQLLPGIPVHLLSIKPSPFRFDQIEQIMTANRGFKELAESRPNTRYIDIFSPMMMPCGQPDPSLFDGDMLHLNAKGYIRWTSVLQPVARALAESA